ncbi:Rab28b [Monocercomonoides exilis]|uniref:Rab28b n=1 Tax=Monocercomonoides exilis TaxID=2049356 RepID=UPI00355A9EF9|nr:Rab28b [Monocercomonoides exilis]|eukprot:MONOS_14944.1-p1 / transcript=MONOS_14944.1 / gene=MONOS_14944 / organism=Monocercomonoides_exilis_PA203 / gene_product=Rab28b / transcript_product=Rab28b / location=Mono_scaffold01112:4957-6335(+) / protein_length=313 / sequence_SO=supercontig / SO=protein_coding / is_pseudo=false
MSKKRKDDSDSEDEEIDIKQHKVIFLGDGAVGKTSLILRFVQNRFDPDHKYKQTIGLDFFMKQQQLNKTKQAVLQCWDIGGQTIGQKMIKSYLRGAHAILFVYDITNPSSFKNLKQWKIFVDEVFKASDSQPILALVGNKVDIEYQREVSEEKHNKFAKKHNMNRYFTSALTGQNVAPMMLRVACQLSGVKVTSTQLETDSSAPAVAAIHRFGEPVESSPDVEQLALSSSSSPSSLPSSSSAQSALPYSKGTWKDADLRAAMIDSLKDKKDAKKKKKKNLDQTEKKNEAKSKEDSHIEKTEEQQKSEKCIIL